MTDSLINISRPRIYYNSNIYVRKVLFEKYNRTKLNERLEEGFTKFIQLLTTKPF